MSYLVSEPAKAVIERGVFGKLQITLYNFLVLSYYLYETGAILGRARRNKLTTLVKVLQSTALSADYIPFMKKEARRRLNEFRQKHNKEPDSFIEFIFEEELDELERKIDLKASELMRISLRKTSEAARTGDLRALELTRMDFEKASLLIRKKLTKALRDKTPFEKVYPFIEICGREGIGFGSSFPALTEKMYRNAHETIIDDKWSWSYVIKPPSVTLEEWEKVILVAVAAYTSLYYPELLDPLDLRSYIDTKGNP
jgi:hypothetical protein